MYKLWLSTQTLVRQRNLYRPTCKPLRNYDHKFHARLRALGACPNESHLQGKGQQAAISSHKVRKFLSIL